MNKHQPAGLTAEQWSVITKDLLRETTAYDYSKVIRQLHSYENGKFNIMTMSHKDALDYHDYLKNRVANQDHMSANTMKRYIKTLCAVGKKLESRQDLFPGYKNPFSNVLPTEAWESRTVTDETLPDRKTLAEIEAHLDEFPLTKRIILRLLMHVGLTPTQISYLTVSDFFIDKETDRLCINVRERTHASGGNDECDVFVCSKEFTALLKQKTRNLGKNADSRYFLMSSKHRQIDYYNIHKLVENALLKAALPKGSVSPAQLTYYPCLYASMHSDVNMNHHAPAGYWKGSLPASKQRTVKSIIEHYGEETVNRYIHEKL